MKYYCPYPLAYAEPNQGDSVVWVLEKEGCSVRCPTVTYTENEWDLLEDLVFSLMVASFVATCVSFVHHVYYYASKPAYFCRMMFLFGFLAICVVMSIFLGLNYRDHELVCAGDGAYLSKGGFCVFQAAWVIFFLIWIQTWSFFMALENYIQITNSIKGKPEAKYNKVYFISAVVICSVCAGVPLIQKNFGFDYKGNIPFCLFLISDTRLYFKLFLYSPFCIFSGGCVILTVMSIYEVHKIFVARDYGSKDEGVMMTPPVPSFSASVSSKSAYLDQNSSKKSDLTTALHNAFADPEAETRDTDVSENFRYSYSHEYNGDVSEETVNPQHLPIQHLPTYSSSSEHRASTDDRPVHEEPGVDYPIFDTSTAPRLREGLCATIQKALVKMWQFNGRQMLFFLVFCLSTIAIVPIIHYIYIYGFDAFVRSNEEFLECLVYSGYKTMYTVPNATQADFDYHGRQDCGRYPVNRPHPILVSNTFSYANCMLLVNLIYYVQATGTILFFSVYGIFPTIIYGTSSSYAVKQVRLIRDALCCRAPSDMSSVTSSKL
jgi:hypothetical protein